ncbi:MAG: Gfo/Idh/MocA family oxidoreductase [Deinococcota bacterium]
MSNLRLGILSFAHMHAYSYAASILALPNCELVAIYDDDEARGQASAEQYQTTYADDLESFLANNLDGVIICSENAYHRKHVEAAAGKVNYILCEKPLATTLEDGRAMLEQCRTTNTHLQLAFPVRFAPPVERLRSAVQAGNLGTLYCATCTNHGKMPGGWFCDTSLAGGGAVMDHTVHVVDALRWITEAEVTEVYADIRSSLMHPKVNIDDAGLLSFTMTGGLLTRPLMVSLDASWSRPEAYPTWGNVTLELVGSNGTLWVDAFKQYATVHSNTLSTPEQHYWGSNIDRRLIADFCEAIRTQRTPSITGEDGLKALEVALAAYESAQLGRPQHLPKQ